MIGQAVRGKRQPDVVKEIVKEIKSKSIFGGLVETGLVTQTSVSDKLLKANDGWVFRNNDVIAKEVSTIEFELFTTRIVKGQVDFKPILSHPILDLLDKFNEYTSAGDGFYNTTSHKNLAGDAFWYLEGKGKNISNIYLLPPDKIRLNIGKPEDGQSIVQSYKYENTIQGNQISEVYKPEEIIHFKNPDPNNEYRGKSKVVAAAEAIDTDNYAITAMKSFFERGMLTNFVLSTPNSLTDEQLKQLNAELRSNNQGAKNAGKAMILSGGLEPKNIQLNSKEMEFIEQQKWLRDKIMSIFGNTPASIGIVEDVNRANSESGILHWKRTTIKSEMKSICDTLNEFLVPRYGTNLVLGFKDPVPEDRAGKVEEIKGLIESNVITQNEARGMVGLDPLPDADSLRTVETVPEIPKSVKNVSYGRFLRKNGVYGRIKEYNELKEKTLPIARSIVKKRNKPVIKAVKEVETQEHPSFTNDQVWNYHNKKIRLVESYEDIFQQNVEVIIKDLVNRSLDAIPDEIPKMQKKQLINEEDELRKATTVLTPILTEMAILSGTEALKLIDVDEVYTGFDIREQIKTNVTKFTKSMIETDREKLIDLIAEGVAKGESVPTIRQNITKEFATYSKMQAERITRTEVLRASHDATLDAWEQSGIVIEKQWLTAMDERVCPYCAPLNGKTVELKTVFFKKGSEYFGLADKPLDLSYGSVKGGNLHVNCRCDILPVVRAQKKFDADAYLQIKGLEQDKLDLKNEIEALKKDLDGKDKRTKEYKDGKVELEKYVKQLEDFINAET